MIRVDNAISGCGDDSEEFVTIVESSFRLLEFIAAACVLDVLSSSLLVRSPSDPVVITRTNDDDDDASFLPLPLFTIGSGVTVFDTSDESAATAATIEVLLPVSTPLISVLLIEIIS